MHVMVDIETLDTKASAIIVSIGAVRFNPNAQYSIPGGETFYAKLDMQQQINAGRTISDQTLRWWMAQERDAARDVFGGIGVTDAFGTLAAFASFCKDAEGVWSNGSDFDSAILMSANEVFNVIGWKYSCNRCFRTARNIAVANGFTAPEREGVHHNALDDARYQARCLQAIVQHLEIQL